MTTLERFEREIPRLMDEIAPARTPDYLDDMLRQTAARGQRPAWSPFERWLPMGGLTRTAEVPRVPWRAMALVTLLAITLVAAGLIVTAGSPPAVPDSFGPATNGALLYRDWDGSIRSIDPTTGFETSVATAEDGLGNPVPSRDGRRAAFYRASLDPSPIVIADIDGSNPTPLAGEYMAARSLDWSPDGRHVAFLTDDRGTFAVVVAAVDGSASTTLPLERDVFQLWYLPDGRLAMVGAEEPGRPCLPHDSPTNECALYLVDPDAPRTEAGFPTMILPASEFDGLGLHPSPDGTKAVYVNWQPGWEEGRLHIVELSSDIMGTRDRRLPVEGLNGPYAINRAWFSPDGSAILFDLFEEDGDHWAIVPSDGGPVRRIGPEWPGDGTDASWSPDGRSVLAHYWTNERRDLWVLDATGTGEDRRLDVDVPSLPAWQRGGS